MLLRKAALEILCLPRRLKTCEVKCLCLNKHLSWEELGCWSTAGWELAAGPNWELRRILWQSWHLIFDCLFSTFRCNRYPGAGVTKLALCCCHWFSNCTKQCGGIEGGDGCERNSCLENHRGVFMPGILSYLLSPKGGPSHLGDSVAPETTGHMTMRLLAAAKSGAECIFCSSESWLGDSEGLNVEKLGYFRRGYQGKDILTEPVV